MRSWSTRRWRKGSPGFSARCPPGPDAVCRYLPTPDPNPRDPMIQTTKAAHRTIKARDLDIFYREAGPKDAPAALLLHGFPSSAQMFRNLSPALADRYEFAPLEQITGEHFHRQFDLHVLALLLTTQVAVKHFGLAGGSIVNLSSVVAAS